MALIDVVKWESNKSEFCQKFPSNDLRIGSQLVVNTAQKAFFVKGGQILDEFESGTYTLKSENLPILNKLINLPFGGNSPFQAEVWFVNQISRLDMKWGTPTPIQLEDPKYSIIVPVRAFGQYGIKIVNPRLFLETLIGNMPSFHAEDIDNYFKGKLISRLSQTIARKLTQDSISILEISNNLVDISDYCNEEIDKSFTKYGISLVDFTVMSINVPQDDPCFIKLKEAKAKAAEIKIQGRDIYQMQRSFDVLEKAASNEGSGMSPIMGVGVGMGFGSMIGGIAQQNINTNPPSMGTPPPMPQETTWFLYINGQQIGGQTYANILSLKAQGQIDENTLVWKSGMAAWQRIISVPELASIFAPMAVPTPPIPPQV